MLPAIAPRQLVARTDLGVQHLKVWHDAMYPGTVCVLLRLKRHGLIPVGRMEEKLLLLSQAGYVPPRRWVGGLGPGRSVAGRSAAGQRVRGWGKR